MQRNLATKIQAKQGSSLTTVQFKQDPPVCNIIGTDKERRKGTDAIPDQQYLTSKFY